MPFPLVDLQRQYRDLKPEIDAAIAEVLAEGSYILGPAVARFEAAFASAHGAKHGIALNSGTSALHLALLALGIGAGDEVVTVPMTFLATAAAIAYTGAKPTFVDVDPTSWCMDPSKVEAAITPRTRAILPVHLHGRPADMDAISAIAARHGIPVIEDAAQAHGARYRGRTIGSIGRIGCFSFYPSKNLGAYGEGGAVVTNDDGIAAKIRSLRDWGQKERGVHELLGYNYRMDGVQGAILGVKLSRLPSWSESRRRVAALYDKALASLPVERPAPAKDSEHVYHVYSILLKDRDRVRAKLAERGIATGVHYALPIHLQPCFAHLGHKPGAYPVAERLGRDFLSLPLYPELTGADVTEIVSALEAAIKNA